MLGEAVKLENSRAEPDMIDGTCSSDRDGSWVVDGEPGRGVCLALGLSIKTRREVDEVASLSPASEMKRRNRSSQPSSGMACL